MKGIRHLLLMLSQLWITQLVKPSSQGLLCHSHRASIHALFPTPLLFFSFCAHFLVCSLIKNCALSLWIFFFVRWGP